MLYHGEFLHWQVYLVSKCLLCVHDYSFPQILGIFYYNLLNRFFITLLFYISSFLFSTNSEIWSLSVGCFSVLDVVDVFIVSFSCLFVVFLWVCPLFLIIFLVCSHPLVVLSTVLSQVIQFFIKNFLFIFPQIGNNPVFSYMFVIILSSILLDFSSVLITFLSRSCMGSVWFSKSSLRTLIIYASTFCNHLAFCPFSLWIQ